jgi:hypothetical protein
MTRSFERSGSDLFPWVSHFDKFDLVSIAIFCNDEVFYDISVSSNKTFLLNEASCCYQIVVSDSVVDTTPDLIDCLHVDDLFPVYSHNSAFAKPATDGGWWLPLIEKVYAKANVNYEMLTTGSQSEAGQFLTGAPAKDFKSNQEGTDQTWIRLTEAL